MTSRMKAVVFSAAAVVAGAIATLIADLPSPASAQPYPGPRFRPPCLQNNRIWGWQAIDERTLIVTDRQNRPFLVRLGGGCVGLNNARFGIRFNTWTNLGCLRPGERVSFRDPFLGEMTCFIRDVRPYGPFPNERFGPAYRGS